MDLLQHKKQLLSSLETPDGDEHAYNAETSASSLSSQQLMEKKKALVDLLHRKKQLLSSLETADGDEHDETSASSLSSE